MGIYAPRVGAGGAPSKVTGGIALSEAANSAPVINAAGTKMYLSASNGVRVIDLATKTVSKTMTSSVTPLNAIGVWGTTLYALTGNTADSTCPTFSLTTETQQSGTNWYTGYAVYPDKCFASNSTGLFLLYSGGPWSGVYYSYIKTVAGTGGGQLQVGDNGGGGGAVLAGCIAANSTKIFACGNAIAVVDIASWTVTTTIAASSRYGCAMNPAGTKLYTTNGSTSVNVINATTNTLTKTISHASFSTTFGVVFNNAGTKAYVANYYGESISVIDTASDSVIGTITTPSGSRPTWLSISPDDSKLYVTYNHQPYSVTIVEGIGAPSASLEVPTSLVRSSLR